MTLATTITSDSYLEYAFLRWVLTPAVHPAIVPHIVPQYQVPTQDHTYRLDYAILGVAKRIAIELDGFAFHSGRWAFTYDRLRQNDLQAEGWSVLRFSYDAIQHETARCVAQLQSLLAQDGQLRTYLTSSPSIERPDMPTTPLMALAPSPLRASSTARSYFDGIRASLSLTPLRDCQLEAFSALGNYYRAHGRQAACIMSVGAGKTALGVAATLAFSHKRALVLTPGSVIRGTFARAFDAQAVGNVLYGLPGGPLLPGQRAPHVLTLDRDDGPIRTISRHTLLAADVIITNFHSLGTGQDPEDLIAKLESADIDFIVVDEAHIAAADSYQRAFHHFSRARTLLMSACFQRLDGKPIEADVVYRYRLIDAIADGHAKNLRVHRFAPEPEQSVYELLWPDGHQEQIVGREALLSVVQDERKLTYITAKSEVPLRRIMGVVKECLTQQAARLAPIKPRILFAALGERHAQQLTRLANEHGIACDYLHHSMSDARLKAVRARFEQDSGDLQALVQLKMLGQGYDFPPITIVVPMRPYGSFSEFYQFIGRGIRVVRHPAVAGHLEARDQWLDIIYHAEMGLDAHIATIYSENDMEPHIVEYVPEAPALLDSGAPGSERGEHRLLPFAPEAVVLFEAGQVEARVVHDESRVEQRRAEREMEALAQRYAAYVASTSRPVPFEQFVQVLKLMKE